MHENSLLSTINLKKLKVKQNQAILSLAAFTTAIKKGKYSNIICKILFKITFQSLLALYIFLFFFSFHWKIVLIIRKLSPLFIFHFSRFLVALFYIFCIFDWVNNFSFTGENPPYGLLYIVILGCTPITSQFCDIPVVCNTKL